MTVRHFDVFSRAPGGGNPCPIVIRAGALSADQMQSVAAHYGQETGFVVGIDDGEARLRYFVPNHEMTMCVHATVAAITALADEGLISGGTLVAQTASGACPVTWSDGAAPDVTVEQQPPRIGEAVDIAREVERAAGLRDGAVDDRQPIRAVSVSRAKLIVPVRTAADVHAADPDLPTLWALCRRLDTTGGYLFAPHDDGRADHVVARQFPVDAGFPEDPATGVAAAALAVHLADQVRPSIPRWSHIDVDQGDAMARPSRLRASAYCDAAGVHRSTVTGRAVARHREELGLTALLR